MTTTKTFPSRRFTAICMIAAPLVILAGLAATPWESGGGAGTAEYLQKLKDNPGQGQLAADLLHYGYLLPVPMIFGLIAHSRPGKLRAISGTIAFVGAATISGAVSHDFFDIGLVQTLPLEQAVATTEHAAGLTGALAFYVPGFVGMTIGLPLLGVAAWRSGLVAAWMPAGVLGAWLLLLANPGPALNIAAGAVLLGALGLSGLRLLRREAAPAVTAVAAAA